MERVTLYMLLSALLLPAAALAQPQDSEDTYIPPENCPSVEGLETAGELACEQIQDSLAEFSESGQELGEQAGELVLEVSDREVTIGGRTFDGIARRNPLDENNGHDPRGRAWEEYVHDSKAALHPDTFFGCFEPRRVIGQDYNKLCARICPSPVLVVPGCPRCRLGEPGCRVQSHVVVEYYFPAYQIAANKAGSRSIDVTMFSGYDNDPQLLREGTAQHQELVNKPQIEEALERLGVPADGLVYPDWHQPGEERYLQINEEGFDLNESAVSFPITYQTNVHAQATRDRPFEFWEGYLENRKSALWCFDDPSKKIIGNSMDHGNGVFSRLSRMAEFTAVVWPEAYNSTVNLSWNLYQTGQREELPQGIIPSYRMSKWPEVYGELERVGVVPGGSDEQKDWVLFGGTLAPFNVGRFNTFTDPLRADLFRIATAALLFGSKRSAFGPANSDGRRRRTLQFTRYRARSGEGREGYTGEDDNVEDPIVFVDKLQLVYPPLEDGDPRRGSECFRPENIANSEPGEADELEVTSTGHISFPKDLRRQFLEQGFEELNRANETRVVVWTKRVLCACQLCGRPFGCTTLNHGDYEEDGFAGNGGEFNTLPPPFAQLGGFLHGYARRESPPPPRPRVLDLLSKPASDSGDTGPVDGMLPQNVENPPPSVPNIGPPLFPLLACLPFGRRSARITEEAFEVELFEAVRPFNTTKDAGNSWFPARSFGSLSGCSANGCRSFYKAGQLQSSGPKNHLCRSDGKAAVCSSTNRTRARLSREPFFGPSAVAEISNSVFALHHIVAGAYGPNDIVASQLGDAFAAINAAGDAFDLGQITAAEAAQEIAQQIENVQDLIDQYPDHFSNDYTGEVERFEQAANELKDDLQQNQNGSGYSGPSGQNSGPNQPNQPGNQGGPGGAPGGGPPQSGGAPPPQANGSPCIPLFLRERNPRAAVGRILPELLEAAEQAATRRQLPASAAEDRKAGYRF